MAFTEATKFFLGIEDDGQIDFRRTRIISENNEPVGERIFRQILEPGQDVSSFPPKVRAICNFVWTPAVIAAYQAAKAAR
jgi:hypothetical protein